MQSDPGQTEVAGQSPLTQSVPRGWQLDTTSCHLARMWALPVLPDFQQTWKTQWKCEIPTLKVKSLHTLSATQQAK